MQRSCKSSYWFPNRRASNLNVRIFDKYNLCPLKIFKTFASLPSLNIHGTKARMLDKRAQDITPLEAPLKSLRAPLSTYLTQSKWSQRYMLGEHHKMIHMFLATLYIRWLTHKRKWRTREVTCGPPRSVPLYNLFHCMVYIDKRVLFDLWLS